MEQIIIAGVGASGTIAALPGTGIHIKSVEIDIPLDEVGPDPILTLSGSATGAYSFNSDTSLELIFQKGENVIISTADFTAEYSAIIRYLTYGEQNCYMAINNKNHTIPIPWRLRN